MAYNFYLDTYRLFSVVRSTTSLIIMFLWNHIFFSHNRQINNTTGIQPKDQLARKIAKTVNP